MEDYSKFLNIYANIPKSLRSGIIAVVDGDPYTWYTAYYEISNGTELGQKIYQKLIDTEII